MSNKESTQTRYSRGFIQIPFLLLIVFGALVTTGGGYYAIKHTPQSIQQRTIVEEENKTATTSADVATTTELSFASKITQTTNSPKSQGIMWDVPITPPNGLGYKPIKAKLTIPKADDNEKRFQEFVVQGREMLVLLEQNEKNFKLLTDTIAQHKKQSAEHATQIMDEWVALVEQTIVSTPSQYSGLLLSTKSYLVSDRNWVVDYSNSLYGIVSSGSYLLSQTETNSLEFVKKKITECLSMDIEKWVVSDELACTTGFLDMKSDYSKRLTDGANRLAEVDLMVLETIGKHSRSAEDDVKGDMDSIARYVQLDASIRASYNSINSQLQQRQSQFEAASTPIKCYTSTNDSIFNPNRTYSTICQPDTRTAQQICDEKIAAWVSGASNGAVNGSKPTCG